MSIPGPIPSQSWLHKAAVPESWIILQTRGKTWRKFFNFQTGSPGKRKVLVTTGETRQEETALKGGWLLLVTMEQFLLPLESL